MNLFLVVIYLCVSRMLAAKSPFSRLAWVYLHSQTPVLNPRIASSNLPPPRDCLFENASIIRFMRRVCPQAWTAKMLPGNNALYQLSILLIGILAR